MYIDSTKRINLVSLKNIDIWVKKSLKYQLFHIRAYVFWPLLNAQPFFDQLAEIFNGSSEDYYLSIDVKKSWFWALFALIDFWALNKGVAPQVPLWVWGLKARPKS